MGVCGFLGLAGLAPVMARGWDPFFTEPELADPLAEALAQPLVLVNPMAAGVADLQGTLFVFFGHSRDVSLSSKFLWVAHKPALTHKA